MLQAQKKGTWAIYRGNLLELSLQHEDVCVLSQSIMSDSL